ncbi:hypothetical protein P8452_77886 [Trifolium repens]|nr:hypothetical protein P8452_77886 [Trifolium repens]
MTVMVRSCFLQWCFESYHPLFSAHLFRRWLLSVVCGGVVSDLSLRQIFHGSLTLSLPRLRRRSCLCGGCVVGCVLASWFLILVQSLMVADPAVYVGVWIRNCVGCCSEEVFLSVVRERDGAETTEEMA